MEELGLEYRYLARLLQKKISRKEFEIQLEREIRRYAKRQITYWKRNKEIHWLTTGSATQARRLLKPFLSKASTRPPRD
jgi:tRNA dimethylallyltransferase